MRAGRGSIVTVLWTSASLGKAIDRCRLMPQSRRARSTLAGVKDRDSIVGLACPNCGAILTYLGHLDGGNPDGARFNVVLWECGGCRGRELQGALSATMIRPILKYGDSLLHQPAREVEQFDGTLQTLIDDMVETMYAAPGVGLAATQIGVSLRVFVIDISVGRDPRGLIAVVNPKRW